MAVAIVAFFGSWNDYLFAAAFITKQSMYTAGLGISTFITDQSIKLDQLEAAGAGCQRVVVLPGVPGW